VKQELNYRRIPSDFVGGFATMGKASVYMGFTHGTGIGRIDARGLSQFVVFWSYLRYSRGGQTVMEKGKSE
jgi:hypothetical protein